ncbi:porin [Salmonella enterica subsp. enterica]|nr:porin [Salmonella enterica subsp. enterica]
MIRMKLPMVRRTRNGVLTYRNNDFFGLVDGLNIALQYQE